MARLINAGVIEKRLRDRFSAQQCSLSKEALTILAAWNLHNYGGSDEATEMAIAGTLDVLFHDIGFECSPKQLGKSVPSSRTIARYEHILAVDCLIKVLQEIKDDGAKTISIICDHGHRGGQDHFVIIIVWSEWKDSKKTDRTLKFFCPSIDHAGLWKPPSYIRIFVFTHTYYIYSYCCCNNTCIFMYVIVITIIFILKYCL